MAYETTKVIDTSELSDEKRVELARQFVGDDEGGVTHMLGLKGEAIRGEFDTTPRTITTEFHGDSIEAALGRAYKFRDTIENRADVTIECEPTGKEYLLPSTTFYEIALHIESDKE